MIDRDYGRPCSWDIAIDTITEKIYTESPLSAVYALWRHQSRQKRGLGTRRGAVAAEKAGTLLSLLSLLQT